MNNEKYRVWNKITKQMKPVDALEVYNGLVSVTVRLEDNFYAKWFPPHIELMRYVGRGDRSGQDVFVGDIVKATLSDDNGSDVREVTEEVHFCNGLLCPFFMRVNFEEDWWQDSLVDGFKVVGNIYETPKIAGVKV